MTLRTRVGLALGAVLACALGPGCPAGTAPGVSAPPSFVDVTDDVGLAFVHDAGATGRYFMPQIMGSGAALFDFDGDGDLDVYLITNGGPDSRSTNRLFRQEADHRFADVSAGSGLDVAGWGMGVAIGDVDNDGRPDLFLTEYGRSRLFRNLGDGKFADVTRDAGIDNTAWGTSTCFVDYDRDGWLDLVVVNYLNYDPSHACGDGSGKADYCHPSTFPGTRTRLFRNVGRDRVRFEDVTDSSGLGRLPGPGLGVVCADFTGDGWVDIFVANDARANRLWVNRHDGTFVDEAVERGVAYNGLGNAQANMGVALGDVNGDGLRDLFVTHLTEELHTLWLQSLPGRFRDRTAEAELAAPRWRGTGFGTVMADFDHDGTLDLAVANGRVTRGQAVLGSGLDEFWSRYAERNQLFFNTGQGKFRDASPEDAAFCGRPAVWRGLAWGDVDGDGALDLLATTTAGPARLFRNVVPRRGHWLMVRALTGKRDAIGAEVTVRAAERTWLGMVNPGQSYLCSGDPRAHFGLGSAERVDSLRVLWPEGDEEEFPVEAVDRVVTVRRGEGVAVKK